MEYQKIMANCQHIWCTFSAILELASLVTMVIDTGCVGHFRSWYARFRQIITLRRTGAKCVRDTGKSGYRERGDVSSKTSMQ
jgi:hypothetical protein